MVTMADVAERAEVSTATVSHVLNDTRFVSDETRHRVLQAIETTGYIHNTLARSLVTSSTQTIGIAMSAISNPYFIELVNAIEAEIRAAGYIMMLADTRDDPADELRVVRSFHQRRVDGFVVAPSADPQQHALHYLARHGLPAVLVDRLASNSFDQVGTENVEATSQLVEHLAAIGHHRIAFIAGKAGLSTTDERLDGYRLGLRRSGLSYEAELVTSGASDAAPPARDAVRKLLALPHPPGAIVASNNHMTIGAMEGLTELGYRVPDDIALACFDDFEWAHLFHPRLTVVAQPIAAIGARAAQLLLARLAEPERPPQTVRLSPTFIHRESCGCDRHDLTAPQQRGPGSAIARRGHRRR